MTRERIGGSSKPALGLVRLPPCKAADDRAGTTGPASERLVGRARERDALEESEVERQVGRLVRGFKEKFLEQRTKEAVRALPIQRLHLAPDGNSGP